MSENWRIALVVLGALALTLYFTLIRSRRPNRKRFLPGRTHADYAGALLFFGEEAHTRHTRD